VLRAVVFNDTTGAPLLKAQFADFAVIWDEDHDDRIFEPIERIYRCGLLPQFLVFGERKGVFTAILSKDVCDRAIAKDLGDRVSSITQHLSNGDTWLAHVVSLDSPEKGIIGAEPEKVDLYLKNLNMLWQLGLKEPWTDEILFGPLVQKPIDEFEFSVRASNCLRNEGIIYLGDLVQKSEAELRRSPNLGNKSVNEIKAVLASLGLHFSMKVAGGRPV